MTPIPLNDESGTKSRPTPVTVLEIRPGSVPGMQDWFAAMVEALTESEIYVCAKRFGVDSLLWLAGCTTGVVLCVKPSPRKENA
jgi:hypothetical protein